MLDMYQALASLIYTVRDVLIGCAILGIVFVVYASMSGNK